jgi:glycosyltransferase involved in cell wall biosynthesis
LTTFALPTELSTEGEIGNQRLSVLVLDEFIPFPLDAGKTIRTWNLLKPLAGRHSITLLCHGNPRDAQIIAGKKTLEAAGINVHFAGPLPSPTGAKLYRQLMRNCFSAFPYSVTKHTTAAFRSKLQSMLRHERFDLVHCEWTPYAQYMTETAEFPFIIDAHNVETLIWKRRSANASNPAAKLFFSQQASKMRRFEKRVFAQAQCVAAVSEAEAGTIGQWGATRAEVVHNGVDLEAFAPAYAGRSNEFLFLGSLDWFPNQDAVSYLVKRLIPQIRQVRHDATFRVVGRRPSPELRRELDENNGVHLSADVDDVRPFLRSAAALIVPLRIGGGTRIKILEAMSSGCPVISSSIGCEGLEVRDGENVLLCNQEDEYITAAAHLLGDSQLSRKLGEAGRKLVEQRYSWNSAAERLESIWQSVAMRSRAHCHA